MVSLNLPGSVRESAGWQLVVRGNPIIILLVMVVAVIVLLVFGSS